MEIRDSKLKKDRGGWGGSRRERIIVQSFTDAELIVQPLVPFLKPSDLPEHLGVFALISITAPFDSLKLNFCNPQLLAKVVDELLSQVLFLRRPVH